MRRLSDTINRLLAIRSEPWPGHQHPAEDNRLTDLEDFGSNPGDLVARAHVPVRLSEDPALVVVLHGCNQNAGRYDHGSGWSTLAKRHGFALLYPEQKRRNNLNMCFNWFSTADTSAGSGEAFSIRQMIGAMIARHG